MERIICHIDLDAFFAAVEERDRPWLKGKPVVVGADPQEGRGRGVVSTANYQARKFGIGSAMPVTYAWRLAKEAEKKGEPKTVFLSPRGRRYGETGRRVAEIVGRHIPAIQRASIDELYGDLTFTGSYEKAAALAKKIKQNIKSQEKITASVGIGPNKLVAKIASDFEKPDGLTVVRPGEVIGFLSPLHIKVIPGVGPKAQEHFRKIGVSTIAQARCLSHDELTRKFGKWGSAIYKKVRGIDQSPLTEQRETKSIGEQETFERDTLEPERLIQTLFKMCDRVFRSLGQDGFLEFRTIVLVVRFGDFKTASRSRTFKIPIGTLRVFRREALKLLMPFLDKRENPGQKKVRLIGIRAEKLVRIAKDEIHR